MLLFIIDTSQKYHIKVFFSTQPAFKLLFRVFVFSLAAGFGALLMELSIAPNHVTKEVKKAHAKAKKSLLLQKAAPLLWWPPSRDYESKSLNRKAFTCKIASKLVASFAIRRSLGFVLQIYCADI